MKQFWLRLDPNTSSEYKAELLKSAETRSDVVVLDPADISLASGLKLRTASADDRAEIRLLSDNDDFELDPSVITDSAIEVIVKDHSDELKALEMADKGIRHIIVRCPDWKVIPLENLIAQTRKRAALLADVRTLSEAKLALEVLELGVDGVVFSAKTTNEIEDMERLLGESDATIALLTGKVLTVKPIGSGARVCVDTCEIMQVGEGMLVGSQSAGLFLVEAEVHQNPHVEPRPFRVNAGPVSSYVLTPGFKTRYLCELKAGDEVLVIDRNGITRSVHIARVKIERRPMMLIETESNGQRFSTVVQNAETVRLMTKDTSHSVSDLKEGDEILLRVEEGGRHFGTLVPDEMVIEH
jgi:3-dehydroquinate synthase II